jgi:hypothetical protein
MGPGATNPLSSLMACRRNGRFWDRAEGAPLTEMGARGRRSHHKSSGHCPSGVLEIAAVDEEQDQAPDPLEFDYHSGSTIWRLGTPLQVNA